APLASEAAEGRRREKALWDHTVRVVQQAPPRPAVRWAALMHDAAKPMTRVYDPGGEVNFIGHERVGADIAARTLHRLKADKTLAAGVRLIVELHGRPAAYEPDWTDSAVRRLALEAGAVWDDLLDLAAADVTSAQERKQLRAAERIAQLRRHFDRLQAESALDRLQSPLDGDELMRLFGRPPGIWIKDVKAYLRDLVIDGDLAQNDTAAALGLASAFLDVSPVVEMAQPASPAPASVKHRATASQREQAVAAIQAGQSQQDVAAAFGVSLRTIDRWRHRASHNVPMTDKSRSGRPPWFQPADRQALIEWVKANPEATLAEVSAWWETRTGRRPGLSTISRVLRNAGLTRPAIGYRTQQDS
ncbi:MAG: helix-turn-helix domain-containing protein, partial [Thermomicrobiales bacterium]